MELTNESQEEKKVIWVATGEFFILLDDLWLDSSLDSGEHLIENTHHDGQTLYENDWMNTLHCGSYFWYFMRYVSSYTLQQASLAIQFVKTIWLEGKFLCDLMIAEEDGSLVVQIES